MTKNEFKGLRGRLSKKMDETDVERKALQRAIDIGKGDTGRIKQKHNELRSLLNELSQASH